MATVYEEIGGARVRALKPRRISPGLRIDRPFVVKLSSGLTVILMLEEQFAKREKVFASYRTQCCGAHVVLALGQPVCKNCKVGVRVTKQERELVLKTQWGASTASDDDHALKLMEIWLAEKDPLAAVIEAPDALEELLTVAGEELHLVAMSERASKA